MNFTLLEEPVDKVVAFLDEEEFHSTWLGNKAIYRTRMLIKDEGELLVLAPGIKKFGEDARIDALIRKYGYRTTPELMALLGKHEELKQNLSAVAHLVHGSSEGRFKVTYATNPAHGGLTREEVEGVGYEFEDYQDAVREYWVVAPATALIGVPRVSIDCHLPTDSIIPRTATQHGDRSKRMTQRGCRADSIPWRAGSASSSCRRRPWGSGPPRRASNVRAPSSL